MDIDGKSHGAYRSVYRSDSYGDDVEVDEEYDNVNIDDLDTSADGDYSEFHSHYWHGRSVSAKEFKMLTQKHQEWIKTIPAMDLASFQKLCIDPDFVADLVGNLDIRRALLANNKISAKDYAALGTSDQELSKLLAFLAPIRADQDKGIFVTFDFAGRVDERFQTKNGERHGFYERYEYPYYQRSGAVCEKGSYQHNTLHGKYIILERDKVYATRNYNNGVLHGPFIRDGGKFDQRVCTYNQGVLVGQYLEIVLTQQGLYKKTGFYEDGKFTGVLEDFANSWACRRVFKNGVCEKEFIFYDKERKKLRAQYSYIKGKRSGVFHEYYENGKVMAKGRYVDDELDGLFEHYAPSGSIISRNFYRNGKIDDTSAEAKDRTSFRRRAVSAILTQLDRLEPSPTRKKLKEGVVKTYKKILSKNKPYVKKRRATNTSEK